MRLVALLLAVHLLTPAMVWAQRTTITHTVVSVDGASEAVLAANGARNFVRLTNDHATAVVYCKWGATAVLNEGFRVNAVGGVYHLEVKVPRAALNCIATGAATPLLVEEGVQ